jgi:hypothetical protein
MSILKRWRIEIHVTDKHQGREEFKTAKEVSNVTRRMLEQEGFIVGMIKVELK